MGDDIGNEIEELDVIKNRVPLEAYDFDNVLRQIPPGTEGAIVLICPSDELGTGYLVDFNLFTDPDDPSSLDFIQAWVKDGQFELVWKCHTKSADES